jgi:hypothetical protein
MIVSAPFIPSAPADLELIAQLKSKLPYAELRIRVLEERLRLSASPPPSPFVSLLAQYLARRGLASLFYCAAPFTMHW